MGSFCRVKVTYIAFRYLFEKTRYLHIPVFGAFQKGRNIYGERLPGHALVALGNEGKGISADIERKIDHKLTIPSFREGKNSAESLNVAVAAGIICSEFKRRIFPF
jgi:TrmH family RNA methyltransferase